MTKGYTADQCVVGIFDNFVDARHAIEMLEAAEYPSDQISLVTQNVEREAPIGEIQVGDKSEHNAAAGAGVGGVIGALVGAPLLTIPGLGLLVAAGPMGLALAGAIVGGFIGAMSGWGVKEDHAREYEEHVRAGDWLIVADGDPQQVAAAEVILEASLAKRVDLHVRTSDDSPEIDDRDEFQT